MITLDRASPISLYEQLYRELKKAIISGELPPGKQLPSTRALALQYDISRNTVNTAYSQLLVEGFITSRPGSGFYVEKIPLPVTLNQTTPSAIPEAQSPSCTYDFSYGSLDFNIYRNRAFRQAMSRAWNNMEKRNSIPYEPAAGSLHLLLLFFPLLPYPGRPRVPSSTGYISEGKFFYPRHPCRKDRD